MQIQRQERISTARRPHADAGISLRKRRAWYDGDPTPDDPPGDLKPSDIPDWVKDPEKALAEIKRLRSENAEGRQAKKKLSEIESQQQTDEAARLAKQGEWEKIAQKREAELAEAKAEIAKRDALDLRRKVAREAGLPEEAAARLTGATEDELKADAAEFKKLLPTAPETPADGKGSRAKPTTTTVPDGKVAQETDEQRRARIYGGGAQVFSGGAVVYNGNPDDLNSPVG